MQIRQLQQAGIVGTGMAVPGHVLTNFELEKIVDTSDEWIRTRSGIKTRHIAGPDEFTSTFGSTAAIMALEQAGMAPEEVELVMVATVTPDYLTPATASIIQAQIGAVNAGASDLGAGCTGFCYALTMATAAVESGRFGNVLVIGADLLSRITNYADRNTCVLLGDGAGAVVVRPVKTGGILSTYLRSDGKGAGNLLIPAGGTRKPVDQVVINLGENKLRMNGNEIYKFAVRALVESVKTLVDGASLEIGDIDWLDPHQANIRIIQAAAKELGIPLDRILVNLDEYGNTSSASIPMALHEAVMDGRIKKGDKVCMVGFGAGSTWGGLLMEWAY